MHFWCLGLILCSTILCAQSVQTRLGGQAAAMGWSAVAVPSEWAGFANPAACSPQRGISLGTAKETSTQLPGASRTGAFAIFRSLRAALSLNAFRFGDDLYSEHVLSAAAAHQIGITQLGMRANWIQYRAEGFGIQRAVSFDVGGLIHLGERFSVGALLCNVSQASLAPGELIPTRLAVGILYKPNERALATAEVEKDLLYNPTWRGGFEYNFRQRMFFRSGFQLHPQLATTGVGFRTQTLTIDYALQYSFHLLFIHQISAQVRFHRKTKKS